jgi:hypothetical protein
LPKKYLRHGTNIAEENFKGGKNMASVPDAVYPLSTYPAIVTQ